MNVQITDLGVAALQAATGPIALSLFKIGSGYNYTPEPTDTDIHGSLLFSGAPSSPVAVNANVIKYGCYMDYSVGPFAWGEFGLYMTNGELFAIGCSSTLIQKLALTSVDPGNSVRLDIYLSIVDTNYEMWMDIGESNNQFRLAVIQSPDVLPQSAEATPNAYVVQSASGSQTPMLAFTDRNGLWSFDCYAYINQTVGTVVGFDSQSVTIALSQYTTDMDPDYFGELILEFTSGVNYSICRYIKTVVTGGGLATLSFATMMAVTPAVGDTFTVFKRQPLSSSNVILRPATTTLIGGVIVGNGLSVDNTGVLSFDAVMAGVVTSINGDTGVVVLTASNIPGLATVAQTGSYTDLINTPAAYTLPMASTTTLGGVKLPLTGNLTSNAGVLDLGFPPVKTVGGLSPDSSGNVTNPGSIGLVDPQAIPSGSDLNTFQTSGLFFTNSGTGAMANAPATYGTLEIIPMIAGTTGGDLVQRFMGSTSGFWRTYTSGVWGSWNLIGGTPALATTTMPGAVQVGGGLQITGLGVLSTDIVTVAGKSPDSTGNVVLVASDVGAFSALEIGTPGNIPGELTANSGSSSTSTYNYLYGRLPVGQNSIGTLELAGTWNANTNVVTLAHAEDFPNQSLLATGEIQCDAPNPNASGNITIQVTAEGRIYRVATAGTTALDGITSWAVGDLAVSIGGLWHKWTQNQVLTFNTRYGAVTLTQADVNAAVAGVLTGTTTMEVRSTGANALLLNYTSGTGGVSIGNGAGGSVASVSSAGAAVFTGIQSPTVHSTTNLQLSAAGGNGLYLNLTSGGNTYFGNGAGGTPAYVDTGGNGYFTNATALSDMRMKHKLGSLTNAIRKVMNLKYFTYELIDDDTKLRRAGTSAQALQAQVPEAVMEREDGKLAIVNEAHTAILGAALQEAVARLQILEDVVRRLTAKLNRQGEDNGSNG